MKERIIVWFKENYIYLKSFVHFKIDGWRLDFAIMMADAMQRAKNKRFYVLENGHGKLIWLCNDDIDAMKRPRYVKRLVPTKDGGHRVVTFKARMMPKHTTHLQVMKDCYYYTPESRNNSNGITVEERNQKRTKWLEYIEEYRANRIYGKVKSKK